MSLTLVTRGKPRRLSEPEIAALTAERVAAWKLGRERARAAWESERNYSERLRFYGKKVAVIDKPLLLCIVGTAGVVWVFFLAIDRLLILLSAVSR